MKIRLIVMFVILSITYVSFGQQNSTWGQWNWLMGNWIGQGSGQPGQGGGTFSFSLDLDKKILVRKSHSEYPAEDHQQATIHDDLMIVYLDHTGNPSNAIYFDNEGHTINYQIAYSDKSIVLTSKKKPNVPIFRLTYTKLDHETIDTKFEMSQDGMKFITYIEGESRKTN